LQAKEKGYNYDARPFTGDTPEEMLETANYALQILRNFTKVEEQELLAAIILGWYFHASQDELLLVTVGSNIDWPDLHKWLFTFREQKFWPRSWEFFPLDGKDCAHEFYSRNLETPTEPLLSRIHQQPNIARRVLIEGWLGWATPRRVSLDEARFDQAVNSLVDGNFGIRGRDLPISARLGNMSIERLRQIQKAHRVKGARSKAQIAENLISAIPSEVLVSELDQDRFVRLDVSYRQLERYWFEYARAKLLHQTIRSLLCSYRDHLSDEDFRRTGLPMGKFRVEVMEDCLCCIEIAKKIGTKNHLDLQERPPFHPGCSCMVMEVNDDH
jgi:hypothetical protein